MSSLTILPRNQWIQWERFCQLHTLCFGTVTVLSTTRYKIMGKKKHDICPCFQELWGTTGSLAVSGMCFHALIKSGILSWNSKPWFQIGICNNKGQAVLMWTVLLESSAVASSAQILTGAWTTVLEALSVLSKIHCRVHQLILAMVEGKQGLQSGDKHLYKEFEV